MKKELLNKVLLSLFVIMAAFSFTSCDEDETENGWYVAVDTDQSSANFTSNIYIQSAVNNQLQIMNNDFRQKMMSESDAKKHFNAMCSELETKVNALELPVLDNTYCTLYLTHAISDPNGKAPVITSKRITFTPKSE
jgi:lipoprotein